MKAIVKVISKWKIYFYILFALLYSLQGLLLSFIIEIAGHVNIQSQLMVLGFGLGGVLLFLFVYVCMYINNLLARSIIKEFNVFISRKALYYFYTKKMNYSASELNSFLTQDIPMFWQEYLIPLLIYPVFGLSILASIIYLLWQNLLIGSLFTIGGFLMIIPQFIFNKRLKKRGEELSQARQDSLSSITDFTKGIHTVQSNQASQSFSKHVLDKISEREERQYQYYITHNLVMFWTGPLKGVGMMFPLIVGMIFMHHTGLTLMTLIAMMTASMNLISPLQQLLEVTSDLQGATVVKEKVLAILALEDTAIQKETNVPKYMQLRVTLKSLSKQFGEKIIFRNVSANIPMGQKVLLTGTSGSGKSTLFSILCGEDADFTGEVYFEDYQGTRYFPSYEVVSLIHQKPYIFLGSVRDNLTLFQDFSDQQLKTVLKCVNLWEELDSDLNYRLTGHNLSGGQIMKIEIARCLLRLKSILLVDEVTAALDEKNAREIRNLIYSQDCTIIEIAHKFHAQDYDSIFELKNSSLIQSKYSDNERF